MLPFASVLPARLKIPISGTFTVRGKHVPPFRMETNPTNAVTKYLFWNRVEGFEYEAVSVFMKLCERSSVFLDIGSNIGYYSLLAAALRGKKISVWAFEPMPDIYEYLERNITINNFKNIVPVRLALSDRTGEDIFHAVINPKFPSLLQLTGDGSLNAEASRLAQKKKFSVQITTLDEFVKSQLNGKKIDLIKLDTEANEHKVLRGAYYVLSDHRPIIQCEVLRNQIESELEDALHGHNYIYYRVSPAGLVQVGSLKDNPTEYNDHYLVPKEKIQILQQIGAIAPQSS